MTEPKEIIGYSFDLADYNSLREVNKKLFGDGSHLLPDQRRDLANYMAIILSLALPIRSGDEIKRGADIQ